MSKEQITVLRVTSKSFNYKRVRYPKGSILEVPKEEADRLVSNFRKSLTTDIQRTIEKNTGVVSSGDVSGKLGEQTFRDNKATDTKKDDTDKDTKVEDVKDDEQEETKIDFEKIELEDLTEENVVEAEKKDLVILGKRINDGIENKKDKIKVSNFMKEPEMVKNIIDYLKSLG